MVIPALVPGLTPRPRQVIRGSATAPQLATPVAEAPPRSRWALVAMAAPKTKAAAPNADGADFVCGMCPLPQLPNTTASSTLQCVGRLSCSGLPCGRASGALQGLPRVPSAVPGACPIPALPGLVSKPSLNATYRPKHVAPARQSRHLVAAPRSVAPDERPAAIPAADDKGEHLSGGGSLVLDVAACSASAPSNGAASSESTPVSEGALVAHATMAALVAMTKGVDAVETSSPVVPEPSLPTSPATAEAISPSSIGPDARLAATPDSPVTSAPVSPALPVPASPPLPVPAQPSTRTELRVLRVSRSAAVVVRVTTDESGAEVSMAPASIVRPTCEAGADPTPGIYFSSMTSTGLLAARSAAVGSSTSPLPRTNSFSSTAYKYGGSSNILSNGRAAWTLAPCSNCGASTSTADGEAADPTTVKGVSSFTAASTDSWTSGPYFATRVASEASLASGHPSALTVATSDSWPSGPAYANRVTRQQSV